MTNSYLSTLSNQLASVTDNASNTSGFNDRNTSGNDYLYDNNGNLTKDLNKGVNTIEYNFLNLPSEVIKGDTNKMAYIYDATGVKLKNIVINGSVTKGKYYFDGFEYFLTKELSLIHFEEGIINRDTLAGTFAYEYFIKDHLGSTRIAFENSSGTPLVSESVDYYPFGLEFIPVNTGGNNKYLYNGKELQDESLGGVNLDWYDYGARFYDPQIGRWHGVDPAADKYSSISPFAFCGNNPINIVDPNGADWVITTEKKDGKTYYNITINGAVYNNSGQNMDMEKLKANMTSQIQSAFSSGNIDGDIVVSTTVNLSVVTSLDDVKDTDHLITIESNSNYDKYAAENGANGVTNGYADQGGLKIVLPNRTAEGIISGSNNRTIAHEMGHTGGLYHPGSFGENITQGVNTYDKSDNNNLMYGVTGYTGTALKSSQIGSVYKYYSAGSLNQKTQFNQQNHILFTPALHPPLMFYQTRNGINYAGQTKVSGRDNNITGPRF